jgi:2-haloalkanoic acid dehalogenase type II
MPGDKPGYLTFDCYGTLIDWREGIQKNLGKAIFGRKGVGGDLLSLYVELEAEEEKVYRPYRQVLERTAARVAERLGRKMSEARATEFASSVPSWPAFLDTPVALRKLGRMGMRRFALSNIDDDLLEGTIKKQGLELDGFVTAQQVGSYKPAPGHWKEFMARTGCRKDQLLHVAQSIYHDIIPANKMGLRTVWVNRYGQPLPKGARPDFIVPRLRDLPPLLEAGG